MRYEDVRPARRPPAGALRGLARHGILSLMGALARSAGPRFARCLFAHWVYDDQVGGFRRLLERLAASGTFVSTGALVEMVEGARPVDRRYFHLSFDDGFDNVYRNAFPLLAEMGIPATLFVPTSFVDAGDEDVRGRWWRCFRGRLPTRPVRWAWLREMTAAGWDIGSHTCNHARLSEVSADPARLREEIAVSKDVIEQRLGLPCRYFSWPWGGPGDIDQAARETIREAGYRAAFAAKRFPLRPGTTSAFNIPRHHFEPDWPWLHVKYFAGGGGEVG